MLGIVFGVFSVIAMLAIGEGASKQAQNQVLQLGATNIIVRSVKPPENTSASSGNSGGRVLRYGLLRADFKLLANSVPTITRAIPIREIMEEATFQDRKMTIRLVGCTPEYFEINHLEMDRKRFISEHDQSRGAKVAVLGAETAKTLFRHKDALGKMVRIAKNEYKVVGITKTRTASAAIGGSMAGQDYNHDVYIPLQTLKTIIGDQVIRRTTGSFSVEKVELSQITLQIKDRESVLPTADVIRESLLINHPKVKDYSIVIPLELLRQADQIRYIFNGVLGSIAAISLVVGGIGIMNIMLATVTERTREIGIRRALGAKKKDIIYQFLMETIVLSGSGGIIGVLMGLLTPFAFSRMKYFVTEFFLKGQETGNDVSKIFLQMEPEIAYWSLPVAFGISVAIGIVFGVYPAQAAAKLDPIEALRHS